MTLVGGHRRPYEIPFVRPYKTASVEHETRQGVLLHLHAEDGTTGLGEAAPLGSRTEDQAACRTAISRALEQLTGDGIDPATALADLDELCPELDQAPAARFAVSLALSDLLAKQADKPLSTWLAKRHTGQTPAETVPVNATLPIEPVPAMADRAQAAVEAGFTTLKLKVGTDHDEDLERVEAVRDAIGPEPAIRLDANQAWAPVQAIENILDHLDITPLEYVEQPVHGPDHRALALVRSTVPCPIAADEPVTGPEPAAELIELEAVDVLILKPMVIGGLDRTLDIAGLAAEAGLATVVTSTIDGAVARAGALHLAASLGPRDLACGLATADLLADDVVDHDERVEDGRMHVPDRSGHGLPLPGAEVGP